MTWAPLREPTLPPVNQLVLVVSGGDYALRSLSQHGGLYDEEGEYDDMAPEWAPYAYWCALPPRPH